MLMTEKRVSWLIDRAFWLFLAGFALMLLASRLGGFGSFTRSLSEYSPSFDISPYYQRNYFN